MNEYNKNWVNELKRVLPSKKIKEQEMLKNYTTFKIGGKADVVVNVDTEEELGNVFEIINQEGIDFFVIGNGSNILASDKGFRGIILILGEDFSKILVNDQEIRVGASAKLRKLVNESVENELSGIEFMAGIPGSVGGAIFMNAGAYGGEIKDILKKVKVYDIELMKIRELDIDECNMSYRKSIFHSRKYIILEGVFELKKGNKELSQNQVLTLMSKRKEKQPVNLPSAGSFFKRPEGNFAGRLIEDSGLKGYSIGDIQISEKHSGFVVNKNNGTSNDVVSLMKIVQEVVYQKFNIKLEKEVEFLGDFDLD